MSARVVCDYPGAPVPPASHWREKVALISACIALGAVIGWRLGR